MLEKISAEALQLPKDERIALADRLVASVEAVGDEDVQAAWDAEIRERIRKYDSGETQSLPLAEVLAEFDKRPKR